MLDLGTSHFPMKSEFTPGNEVDLTKFSSRLLYPLQSVHGNRNYSSFLSGFVMQSEKFATS
jgi:hypothetical protein